MDSFLADYKKFLLTNSNPARAKQEKAYLYSDLQHYGISSPVARNFFSQHKKFLQSLSKSQALKLVQHLWSRPSFEERAAALHILELHLNELDKSDLPLIEHLMRQCRGWALLDNLIIPLLPTLLTKDKTLYNYLKKWITDDDFWVRRSAMLAQLLLFRIGSGGDPELFFQFAKSQFDESWIDKIYLDKIQNSRAKFFIRKAIGWTLREMSLKNPHPVFEFLLANKNNMSGLSFREGSRHLPRHLQEKLNLQ